MSGKKMQRVTSMGDYQDEISATREKPIEQTPGQRIAAELKFSWDHLSVDTTTLAAAIDEAIRDAKRQALEHEADRYENDLLAWNEASADDIQQMRFYVRMLRERAK